MSAPIIRSNDQNLKYTEGDMHDLTEAMYRNFNQRLHDITIINGDRRLCIESIHETLIGLVIYVKD